MKTKELMKWKNFVKGVGKKKICKKNKIKLLRNTRINEILMKTKELMKRKNFVKGKKKICVKKIKSNYYYAI